MKDIGKQPVRVLMIEDNRGDVVLVREAVAKAGLAYRITVVPDGVEAMEYLRRRGKHADAPRPDLIILDLKLPKKGGWEVLDDIRPDPTLNGLPVVLLSSSVSELEIAQSHRRPNERCIVKPSTFEGYVTAVRTMDEFRGKVAGT